MAVDLGSFEFAAPPGVGGGWLLKELESEPCHQSICSMFSLFSLEESSKIRVSVVCHPCRWLSSIFDILHNGALHVETHLLDFSVLLDGDNFEAFVRNYLKHMPGEIGRIFDEYKCDIRMRMEDMPWALVEFLESLGVPEQLLGKVEDPGNRFVVDDRRWDDRLFQEVIEAESKLCLDFDYY